MKILFFLINMNLGGTEKSFLNLLEALPKNVKIDLLLLENYGDLMEEIPSHVNLKIIENGQLINSYINLGCRRFGLEALKKGHLNLFFRSQLQFIGQVFNFIKNPFWAIQSYLVPIKEKYDISIAYAGVHNFIAYYILNKTQATKKVLWIHFDIEKVVSDFNFGKKFYSNFNQIFCVAENASIVFKNRFPATSKKVFTFNNIINNNKLIELGKMGETYSDGFNGFRILTLGRLSEEKGQSMIPQIVKKLKDENFKFRWYLIGEGNLFSTLQYNIKSLGITEELILLGKKMNPYGYLRGCDVYVQTSFYEGDPVVLREAKVFKRPIVTTNFLSASNLIKHNENGLIVEISEEGLFKGVKKILENEPLRVKFSNTTTLSNSFEKNIESFLFE